MTTTHPDAVAETGGQQDLRSVLGPDGVYLAALSVIAPTAFRPYRRSPGDDRGSWPWRVPRAR